MPVWHANVRVTLGRALMRSIAPAACFFGLLVLLVMAVGCNGGEQQGGATPAEQFRTPVARPTYDANAPLVGFHSVDNGYTIGYPEGWEQDTPPAPGTDAFVWKIGDTRLALLQVTCNPGLLSPEALMSADAEVASTFGGRLDPSTAVPVEVAGVEGKLNTYGVSVGGLAVEHIVAYAAKGNCGWRIGLSSYGEGSLAPYLPLFNRIVASFRTD